MCKGIGAYTTQKEVLAAVAVLRDMDMPETEIAERVAKKFDVTVEYVKELMLLKAV